jgi:peptidoglycan/LPS O-acetylase OafA/YrhL
MRGFKALVALTLLCTASALILMHQYDILYAASFIGFPFGVFFSMFGLGSWIKRHNAIVIVAMLAVLAVTFPVYEYTWGLPFVLLVVSLRMLFFKRYENSIAHRAFSKCGNFSYELFLIHWTFLLVIEKYIDSLPLKIVLALIIPCIAAYLVHKPTNALLKQYNKALDRLYDGT